MPFFACAVVVQRVRWHSPDGSPLGRGEEITAGLPCLEAITPRRIRLDYGPLAGLSGLWTLIARGPPVVAFRCVYYTVVSAPGDSLLDDTVPTRLSCRRGDIDPCWTRARFQAGLIVSASTGMTLDWALGEEK